MIMALVLALGDKVPRIGKDVFLAPNATILGDVTIEDGASVWFGAVLRADIGGIVVGARSNLQDLVCVHMTEGLSKTVIGADVTVGHGAVLHGCVIEDRCLIGMGAIVLDNAVIGAGSVIAAGTLVPPRMVVPAGSLVRGNPGKVIRPVNEKEAEMGVFGADHYVTGSRRFRAILSAMEAEEK